MRSDSHAPGACHRLLLAPEIFSSEGGIPRILQLYLRALADLTRPQDELRLISLNDRSFAADTLHRTTSDRVRESRACSRNKRTFIWSALAFSRKTHRIVCGHIAQLPVAWAVSLIKPGLSYDLVAHGIEIWRPFTFLQRCALRRVRRVYCVSEYTRSELLRRCTLPADRAVVLPNAIDPSFEISGGTPLPFSPPIVLLVSRLTCNDYAKGFEQMIRIMPAVLARLPSARLRIIGRGNALADLQSLVVTLGIQASVDFLGYVDDARLISELRSCRLFALPSAKEGFGLVFIEAMACGRPCLGANAGGTPEVITPQTGILVAPGDEAALAAAAVEALSRDWSEEAILERARHFSYPRFKERLAALL